MNRIKLLGLMTVLLLSCSGQATHNALTVFFDGVPEPAVKEHTKKDSAATTDKPNPKLVSSAKPVEKINLHPPYADRNCNICHQGGGSQKLTEQPPQLCYQCHDDFSKKFAVLHGPVANGSCTGCHDPHSSKNDKLLLKDGQQLCYNCHNKKDVLKNDIHSVIEDTKCWDCHDPHGGKDRYLSR